MARPRVNADGQNDLDKIQDKFESFQDAIKDFNPLDVKKAAPESEPQTQLSTKEIKKAETPYIKPVRSINRGNYEKARTYFDERYRAQRDKDWEYVKCIVENNEIIGEAIECWTGKWGCDPVHFWKVPVNKPIFIPKHLAEQLSKCKYHRLRMDQSTMASADGLGTYMGSMVVDETKHRIDCRPVGFGFDSVGF